MNKKFLSMALMVAGLSVVGCTQCPEVHSGYDKVPYGRTAGTGVAVYGGNCPVEVAEPVAAPVVEEPVVAPKAEKVFKKKMMK